MSAGCAAACTVRCAPVFVQAEPGVFARHIVEIGHSFEGFTEVLAGVRAGDVVVTEGSSTLLTLFVAPTVYSLFHRTAEGGE